MKEHKSHLQNKSYAVLFCKEDVKQCVKWLLYKSQSLGIKMLVVHLLTAVQGDAFGAMQQHQHITLYLSINAVTTFTSYIKQECTYKIKKRGKGFCSSLILKDSLLK